MKRFNLRLMLVLLLGLAVFLAACAPEPTPTATPEPTEEEVIEETAEATEEPTEVPVEETEEATEEPAEETEVPAAATEETTEEPEMEATEEASMDDMDMAEEGDMDGMDGGMMGGTTSALYATITNDGDDDVTLIRAETDAAAIVEIHETTVEDDVARMQEMQDGLVIPAGETVLLEPGGFHVMLIDLQQDLIAGEELEVSLVFEMPGDDTLSVDATAEIQDEPLEEGQQPIVVDDLQIELVWARPGAGMTMDDMDNGEMAEEDEEASDGPSTVVDVAAAAAAADEPEFTTLVAALEAADLVDALAGDGPFTVFAPTDAAFSTALEALDMEADELLEDTDMLQSILTYHVAQGEFMEDDVLELDGETLEMLSGFTVDVTVTDDGVVLNNSVNVVTTNVTADNGVIHVIDGVLLPPED